MKNVLIWFSNDMRLVDNQIITFIESKDWNYIPMIVIPDWVEEDLHGYFPVTKKKRDFLKKSVDRFEAELSKNGKRLIVVDNDHASTILDVVERHNCIKIFTSHDCLDEILPLREGVERTLAKKEIYIDYFHTNYWFDLDELPFPIKRAPDDFREFLLKSREMQLNSWTPEKQRSPVLTNALLDDVTSSDKPELHPYSTGLNNLFSKFLPYISSGQVSPSMLYQEVCGRASGKFFGKKSAETLQRQLIKLDFVRMQYFKLEHKTFERKPISIKDYETIRQWIHGNTGIDLIDAIMHKLWNEGNISLTSKRLTIQYFLHVMKLPPHYGFWYFKNQLTEYESSLNFYMWNQYSQREMSVTDVLDQLTMEQKRLDPDTEFIEFWQ